jgi:hypothetical protein
MFVRALLQTNVTEEERQRHTKRLEKLSPDKLFRKLETIDENGVSANRVHGFGRFNLQNLTSFPSPSRVECPHISMTFRGHEADPWDTQRSLA